MASIEVTAGSLVALSVVGFLDALYFVLVGRGAMEPDARWLPRVCRMDEQTCATILETPYARVFGLSNATYGLAWYAIVAASGTVGLAAGTIPGCLALIVVAAGTVVLGGYLVWALLVKLDTPCPLCFLGHGVNAAILVALLVGCG